MLHAAACVALSGNRKPSSAFFYANFPSFFLKENEFFLVTFGIAPKTLSLLSFMLKESSKEKLSAGFRNAFVFAFVSRQDEITVSSCLPRPKPDENITTPHCRTLQPCGLIGISTGRSPIKGRARSSEFYEGTPCLTGVGAEAPMKGVGVTEENSRPFGYFWGNANRRQAERHVNLFTNG